MVDPSGDRRLHHRLELAGDCRARMVPRVKSDTGLPDPKGAAALNRARRRHREGLRVGLGQPLLADQLGWAEAFDKAMEILHLLSIGFGIHRDRGIAHHLLQHPKAAAGA